MEENGQIVLYLVAIIIGGAVGFLAPGTSGVLGHAVNPVLGLLLYATFLAIPFASIAKAVRDLRFLGTVLVLNFAVVPVVVFDLTRFIAGHQVLLVRVLLVLLTPCIDYVRVFTGLAGGSSDRLLAAAPVLMLAQMFLLPVYLLVFAGPDLVAAIDPAPFVGAFITLIIVPLAGAALTQALARRVSAGRNLITALALPRPLALAALVVVTQTLVELVGMVILVRFVPVLVRTEPGRQPT